MVFPSISELQPTFIPFVKRVQTMCDRAGIAPHAYPHVTIVPNVIDAAQKLIPGFAGPANPLAHVLLASPANNRLLVRADLAAEVDTRITHGTAAEAVSQFLHGFSLSEQTLDPRSFRVPAMGEEIARTAGILTSPENIIAARKHLIKLAYPSTTALSGSLGKAFHDWRTSGKVSQLIGDVAGLEGFKGTTTSVPKPPCFVSMVERYNDMRTPVAAR